MVDAEDLTTSQRAILFIVAKLGERFAIDKLYVQKAVFLISKLAPDSIPIFDYEPNKMGMYSPDVNLTLQREQDLGLIEGLKITTEGQGIIKQIHNTPNIKQIEEVFTSISDLGRFDILYLLYKLYPEFTVNSKISEQVESYKLQSLTIDVTELKEGQTTTLKTDKGNIITIKKIKNVINIIDYSDGNHGEN